MSCGFFTLIFRGVAYMAKTARFVIKDFDAVKRDLERARKISETVIKRTVSDMKTRAPGWVAAEVSNVYAISKKNVLSKGNVKVTGKTAEDIRIMFTGRSLSPANFRMTPTAPKPAYTLKAEIIRGKKSELGKVKKLTKKQKAKLINNLKGQGKRTSDHSPIMLMPVGGKAMPYQRVSTDRKDIRKITAISVPQMVRNEKVTPGIARVINENLEKRFANHMKLFDK